MFEQIQLIKPLTSSPNSGEFYLVGLRFKPISNAIFNKLMNQLDNFKVNHCFFKKEEIPEYFYFQIIEFLEEIYKLNTDQLELKNMLITCSIYDDPIIEKATNCKKYLSPEFIKKVQTKRYKEWIKTYKFE